MAKRHGLFQGTGPLEFHFGIEAIFRELRKVRPRGHKSSRDRLQRDRAARDQHFGTVRIRMLLALDSLHQSITRAATEDASSLTVPEDFNRVAMDLEVAIHYFAIVLASLGPLIGHVISTRYNLSVTELREKFEDLGKAAREVRKRYSNGSTDLEKLNDVLKALRGSGRNLTWWERTFLDNRSQKKRRFGFRQRLVHFPDYVHVQPDGAPTNLVAYVYDSYGKRRPVEMLSELKAILFGFCDWLDRLEEELFALLAVSPLPEPLKMAVVWGIAPRDTPKDYMYFPLVEGSPPLKAKLHFRTAGVPVVAEATTSEPPASS